MEQPCLSTESLRANMLMTCILFGIDDSEYAERALRYVSILLRKVREAHVTLFHVLEPVTYPPVEQAESEDRRIKGESGEEFRQEQEDKVQTERVTLKFGQTDNIAHNILDESRSLQNLLECRRTCMLACRSSVTWH